MTNSTADFTNLITPQHRSAPNFVQTVSVTCQAFADQIALMQNAYSYYDVDNAVGAQLDDVGLWVGFSRYVALAVDIYFSWDISGVGWDQGIWWEIGDAEQMVTKLSDATYRNLIRLKILCNQWDGTLPSAISILGTLVSADNCTIDATEGNMSVDFTITGPISSITRAIIEGGYLPLKPAGISVTYNFEDS